MPFAIALASAGIALLVSSTQARPATGSVVGEVVVTMDGSPKEDRSGVVVFLELGPETAIERPRQKKEIHQRELSFVPSVTVVTRGSTIDFPNDDKVFHNVFSLSQASKFDLGLYKSGESRAITFNRAGVVDLYCNIHPDMVASIKVLDSPYFAVTGSDGKFRVDGVPAGSYTLVGWQRFGTEYRGDINVPAGGAATAHLELAETGASRRHLRKDGTPYGRYR
jgi:plastocyanin